MPKSGDEDNVGIVWMDDERANLAGIAQSDIFPVLSCVDRLVNAGPIGRVSANGGFTSANINGVVVGRRACYCANGGNILLIKKRRPIRSAVHGFPNPARDGAEVPGVWLVAHAFDRKCASATERSDLSPLHS